MEASPLAIVALTLGLAVLGLLAAMFGVDSRSGFDRSAFDRPATDR